MPCDTRKIREYYDFRIVTWKKITGQLLSGQHNEELINGVIERNVREAGLGRHRKIRNYTTFVI